MKHVFSHSRRVFALLACVAMVVCDLAVAKEVQGKRPVNNFNRVRRQHYELYKRYDTAVNEPKANPMALFKELHAPIADWCANAAPMYVRWAMQAGDKAKTLTNERAKQQWIEISACYGNMARICRSLVSNFKSDKCALVLTDVKNYVTAEKEARQKRFKCIPRPWLTSDEALQFRWQENAAQKRLKETKERESEGSQDAVDDDAEPRQGGQGRRVRNQSQRIERHGRRGSDGGRQPQRDSRSRGGSRRRR